MPVIVRQLNKVLAATAFLDDVLENVATKLYIGIGRSTVWDNELSPDVPVNKRSGDDDFWSNLIGIGRVTDGSHTTHGKQKIAWEEGVVYQILDATIDKSDVSVGNQFYCVATNGNVYTCVLNNTGTGTGATGEPTHSSGEVTGGDGYRWKFEYDMTGMSGASVLETLNWMPVEAANAEILGANYVMVGLLFRDYVGTGNIIPNDEYRQIALLKNPQLLGGGDATASWIEPASLEDVGGAVSEGIVLTLDNRVKITRAEGQSETIVAILKF